MRRCAERTALVFTEANRLPASAAPLHITMFYLITAYPYLRLPAAPAPKPEEKFPLGRVVSTQGALASIPAEEIQNALIRHHQGDWGDLCEDDRSENERSLREGFRLFSVYQTKAGVKFYIITEHDRSATTVLLPDEY